RRKAHNLSQDAHSSKSPSVPKGWTAEFTNCDAEETMLHYSTGLTATLELAEINGSCYIFSSDKDYYMWNTASEQGWRIINVKSREELYSKMAAKGRLEGLKLEALPDFGSDLEE
ncbi:hypothetical protein EDB19DRAFT_1734638, partial [Suillus lakei]